MKKWTREHVLQIGSARFRSAFQVNKIKNMFLKVFSLTKWKNTFSERYSFDKLKTRLWSAIAKILIYVFEEFFMYQNKKHGFEATSFWQTENTLVERFSFLQKTENIFLEAYFMDYKMKKHVFEALFLCTKWINTFLL